MKALVQDPGIPGWGGPYIDALKPDPWYHPYHYACTAGKVTLSSDGPDGMRGTEDDILAPPPDLTLLVKPVTPEPQ